MLGDLGVNQGAPMGLELGERALFISSHEAAVTGDISRQDGCKTPRYSFAGPVCACAVCSHAVITPAALLFAIRRACARNGRDAYRGGEPEHIRKNLLVITLSPLAAPLALR